LSIASNIDEGALSGRGVEFKRYLSVIRGSWIEPDTLFCLAATCGNANPLRKVSISPSRTCQPTSSPVVTCPRGWPGAGLGPAVVVSGLDFAESIAYAIVSRAGDPWPAEPPNQSEVPFCDAQANGDLYQADQRPYEGTGQPMTEPLSPSAIRHLPLSGLRILAVEQYGAGPYGSMILADLGAEVIKIEPPPGGDVSRATGPYFLGEGDSQFFQTFNLNKRSIRLDLKHPDARRILERLVGTADAVMNNLRGDQPAKLGIDYAALGPIKPAIVCAHLSAYGRDNERAAWPGYDYLMQAEAGFMSLTGEPEGPPARFGLSMVDFMTGTFTALGLLAAILGAQRTGRGCDVDVSLFDVALHQLSYPATWFLNAGHETTRLSRSAHPATVPCQLYRTADGWVMVMCMLEKFWRTFVEGIGRPELAVDPRFVDFAARRQHREALTPLIDEALMAHPTAHWVERFAGRIPIAPVLDVRQALENSFVERIEMLQTVEHPFGPLRMLRNPIRLDGQRLDGRPCPPCGADSEALLREAGFDEAEIATFRAQGTI
jgi:crotonobetainyl-CoA:carnitine CoA-transferase CaiB-like acyl-CoA transferase